MTRADTTDSPRILTIGLDRLMIRALRADFPGARVSAAHRRAWDVVQRRDPPPDLVVVNSAKAGGAGQRAAIWRRWNDDVVVAEFHGLQPVARVWRTPSVMESIEVGPGWLRPFLLPVVRHAERAPFPLAATRVVGYLVVLWNLTVGVHLLDLSPAGVAVTMFGFAVLLANLAYRTQRSRHIGHGH